MKDLPHPDPEAGGQGHVKACRAGFLHIQAARGLVCAYMMKLLAWARKDAGFKSCLPGEVRGEDAAPESPDKI